MKKMIITMLAALCCAGAFAAEFLGWDLKDPAAYEEAMKRTTVKRYKFSYDVCKNKLQNPEKFATFAELKNTVETIAFKYGYNSDFQRQWAVAYVVYCVKDFRKYSDAAFEFAKELPFSVNFLLYKRVSCTGAELWEKSVNFLIDSQLAYSKEYARLVAKCLNMDLRIKKAKKIELYSLLYEKLYSKLADEQKMTAEQKKWTPLLGRVALKLKSLGVDIK